MITRFHDAAIRAPRGGWAMPIGGQNVTAHSEGEIFERLEKWQRNNGKFVSRAEVEREAWAYWCGREPERCGGKALAQSASASPILGDGKAKTPERQGPGIWIFLNVLAAQWVPALHRYFLDTVNAILLILDCPECRAEWSKIVRETPPTDLNSRYAVCRWVNTCHNYVNARRGAAHYPYERMIAEYGAPLT